MNPADQAGFIFLAGEIARTGKGTNSFEYGRPLPVGLVKKVVKTRLAEVAAKRR
jgi:hypothetical protein